MIFNISSCVYMQQSFTTVDNLTGGKQFLSFLKEVQSVIFHTDLFTENCFKIWPDRIG